MRWFITYNSETQKKTIKASFHVGRHMYTFHSIGLSFWHFCTKYYNVIVNVSKLWTDLANLIKESSVYSLKNIRFLSSGVVSCLRGGYTNDLFQKLIVIEDSQKIMSLCLRNFTNSIYCNLHLKNYDHRRKL